MELSSDYSFSMKQQKRSKPSRKSTQCDCVQITVRRVWLSSSVHSVSTEVTCRIPELPSQRFQRTSPETDGARNSGEKEEKAKITPKSLVMIINLYKFIKG